MKASSNTRRIIRATARSVRTTVPNRESLTTIARVQLRSIAGAFLVRIPKTPHRALTGIGGVQLRAVNGAYLSHIL